MNLYPCSKNINSNRKGDRSNPYSYRSTVLLSCISKAFGTILNKWFLKLSSLNLLSDRQYALSEKLTTGDLLAKAGLTHSRSRAPAASRLGEWDGGTLPA